MVGLRSALVGISSSLPVELWGAMGRYGEIRYLGMSSSLSAEPALPAAARRASVSPARPVMNLS